MVRLGGAAQGLRCWRLSGKSGARRRGRGVRFLLAVRFLLISVPPE